MLATLGVCLAIGATGVVDGLRAREAKGAAACWQSAAAWAQVEALCRGSETDLAWQEHDFSVDSPAGLGGQRVAGLPGASVSTNVSRWRTSAGLTVGFTGELAAPDSGGSLYFASGGAGYRVAVRPESGLTARALWEPVP